MNHKVTGSLDPIDLEFNSALENETYLYQKCGSCTQKSNETWTLKIRVKTKKTFVIERLQMESVGTKIFVYLKEFDRIYLGEWSMKNHLKYAQNYCFWEMTTFEEL